MFKRVANFIQGSVLLQVESAYPERVVNLCSAHGVPFWDVRWENDIRFTMRTTRSGERTLRRAAGQTDASIRRLGQTGAPVLAWRLRRRYVLLAGGAILLALLTASNFFVWDFEVNGNDTVSEEEILRALEKEGVTVGCPGLSVDQETLRNHVLLELNDLSWLAVNIRGCVAHVQVVERHRPPPLMEERQSANVIAARDGLVTKVEALDGRAEVLPGTTVIKGQLLISGVTDGGSYGQRLVHGMGNVWARTWYEQSTLVPLKRAALATEGKSVTHYALNFGKQRIKFYGKGSVTPEACDKITTYRAWVLPGGLRLPVTLVTEQWTVRDAAIEERSLEDARQEGEALLVHRLTEQLGDDGSVTETRFASARQGDYLLVTMKAECLEQIGVSVPIDTP